MKKAIKQYKIWFLICGFIVLISPLLLRLASKNFTIPTAIPYYFLLKYELNPMVYSILPIILTIITIFLIYRTALNVGIKKETAELAILLYILSVPVLYMANFLNDHTILLFLIILALFLFTYKNKNKKLNKPFKILAIVVFLLTVFSSMYFNLHATFNVTQPFFQAMISDFGAVIGIGITVWLLAAIGFIISWKYKFRFVLLYVLMFVLIFLASKYLFFISYLNIIVVFFAAHCFKKMIDRKWDMNFVKNLTIIVLICSFLFSAVSFANRTADATPDAAILRSLKELSTYEEGTVLTLPEKAWWIEYYSGQPVFGKFPDKDNAHIANEILNSKNIEFTSDLLDNHNIRYIWIDYEMKEGQVWTSKDQGLLWLLPNKEKFKNLYNIGHVEIWEYID
jgi:hypothetical protein